MSMIVIVVMMATEAMRRSIFGGSRSHLTCVYPHLKIQSFAFAIGNRNDLLTLILHGIKFMLRFFEFSCLTSTVSKAMVKGMVKILIINDDLLHAKGCAAYLRPLRSRAMPEYARIASSAHPKSNV